jgi:hypothetical protein
MKPIRTPAKSRAPLYLALGLLLVSMLAGRFLSQPAAAAEPQATAGVGVGEPTATNETQPTTVAGEGEPTAAAEPQATAVISAGNPGVGTAIASTELPVTPLSELPNIPSDVKGLFVSREDNRLIIGTGRVSLIDSGDGQNPQASYDGPQVEVVITRDTVVFRESMQEPDSGQAQPSVEAGSLDEITSYTTVVVWGRRTGDRVIADVLLYQPLLEAPPGK